jgi:hypothetical protein
VDSLERFRRHRNYIRNVTCGQWLCGWEMDAPGTQSCPQVDFSVNWCETFVFCMIVKRVLMMEGEWDSADGWMIND